MTGTAVVGGTGQPIIGKLTAPTGIVGRIDWTRSTNSLIGKETSPAAGQKLASRRPRSHGVVLARDGSFRVEDVEAGTFDLIFVVNEPPADPQSLPTHKAIGTARLVVNVLETPRRA